MKNRDKHACPYLDAPSAECHIADLHSQNIEKAMYYCWGNYERCEIYRQRLHRDEGKTGFRGTELI